jgi:hypothetical protein
MSAAQRALSCIFFFFCPHPNDFFSFLSAFKEFVNKVDQIICTLQCAIIENIVYQNGNVNFLYCCTMHFGDT